LNSLHDSSSWLSIMFSRHDFLSKSNDLHVFSSCFLSCFSSCFSLCFSSWLSIKSLYQTVFMIFRHDFLSWLFFITFYQSQTIFMFSHHVSCHVSLHVSLYVFLHVSLYVSRHDFLSNLSIKQSSWFFVMTFYHDFSSWLFFIAFLHDFSIMTFLSWLFFMTFYHIVFMFLVMTSIKKIMQKDNAKAKNRKNFYI